MLPGVILAAGRSTRMGTAKALLPYVGSNVALVVRLAQTLADGGVDPVIVVGRGEDEELQRVLRASAPDARFVVNANADAGGQLSSLVAAIDAINPAAAGILMIPVDVPRVSAATVAALLTSFQGAPGRIVRAVHAGRHGHPVVFPRPLFDEIRRADPARGAKAVVRAHPVIDVEVSDPGVLDDLDTPADYLRAFKK